MAQVEKDIMQRLNYKGYKGFPTLITRYNLGPYAEEDNLVTDLIGSSLSWFNKNKQLSLAQVYNIGIQLVTSIFLTCCFRSKE